MISKNHTDTLIVQKHQLDHSNKKVDEISNLLDDLDNDMESFDLFLKNTNSYLDPDSLDFFSAENDSNNSLDALLSQLELVKDSHQLENRELSILDSIDFNEDMTFQQLHDATQRYAEKNNINQNYNDPFDKLLSPAQKVEILNRIKDDFTFKNAECDKYDYMISGTCGLLSGLIDILFVGVAGNSILGEFVDNQANSITEKFAELLGWDRDKAIEKDKNITASAIGRLFIILCQLNSQGYHLIKTTREKNHQLRQC